MYACVCARMEKNYNVLVQETQKAPSKNPYTDEMMMTQSLSCQLAETHHNLYTLRKSMSQPQGPLIFPF